MSLPNFVQPMSEGIDLPLIGSTGANLGNGSQNSKQKQKHISEFAGKTLPGHAEAFCPNWGLPNCHMESTYDLSNFC